LGWNTDPRRTPEWYERTKRDLGDNVYAEYPSSEEEAFLTPGGNFFSELRQNIHIKPKEEPLDWYKKYVSLDYGLDMLAALWYWVDGKENVRIYREVYKSNLIISEAAKAILKANGRDKIEAFYAPPDLWNRRQDTGKSAAQIFYENGITLMKTSNNRVNGWMNVKEYLLPFETRDEQTGASYITSKLTINDGAAPNLWRCLTRIQKSDLDPNDAADQPHELTHAPDSLRAFCVARKLPTQEPEEMKVYNFESEKPQASDGYFGGEVTEDYLCGGF
jgi:phage terminase large subunit